VVRRHPWGLTAPDTAVCGAQGSAWPLAMPRVAQMRRQLGLESGRGTFGGRTGRRSDRVQVARAVCDLRFREYHGWLPFCRASVSSVNWHSVPVA
jgi:hypothetical protein